MAGVTVIPNKNKVVEEMKQALELVGSEYPTMIVYRSVTEDDTVSIVMCSHSEPELIKALASAEGGPLVEE